MTDIVYGGLAFAEAIAYLKQKSNLKTKNWDDILGKSHTHAFTVAGAMNEALLSDLRTAVQSAIDNGTTIAEFRKSFDAAVKKYGWNYKGKRGWRTAVIYDTNLRVAHSAGRWHKIQETKKVRPYLQYITVGDERVRQSHQKWNGKVLLADDKFWDTHYPPNGWGCRCTVRTLNKTQAKKLGIDDSPKIKSVHQINKTTGEDYGQVPVGIDVGWDYNVGKKFLDS